MLAKDTIPAKMAFILKEQNRPGSGLIGNVQLLQEQAGDITGETHHAHANSLPDGNSIVLVVLQWYASTGYHLC